MVIIKAIQKNIATKVVIVYTANEVIALDVGEKIRTIRKFRKLTQINVAQKAQIAVNSLRLYESGKRTPNLDQLKAIAEAMDSSLADLLDERDQKIFYAGADEGGDTTEWVHRVVDGYSFSKSEYLLVNAFSALNNDGQKEAVKRVEELTEIPRYQAKQTPQPTLDIDTTPPPDAPEGPQEGGEGGNES